jgi:hypothetical protein
VKREPGHQMDRAMWGLCEDYLARDGIITSLDRDA